MDKFLCLLFSVLCALGVLETDLTVPALCAFLLLSLSLVLLCMGIKYCRLRPWAFMLLLFSLCLIRLLRFKASSVIPVSEETIVSLEGFLVYDSSYSDSGKLVLNVMVTGVRNVFSNYFSGFRKLVVCISDQRSVTGAFCRVRVYGHFKEGLFICSSVQVLKKGMLTHLRESLILLLEKRLSLNTLGMLLLLGRSEDMVNSLTSSALSCGCAHVLALSGMHLKFVSSSIKRIFGRKKPGKVLSLFCVFLFVFIAGPRPSLVRALIMFTLSFLPLWKAALAACLIQLLLTPWVFLNPANAYGYVCVFSLIAFSGYITWYLKPIFLHGPGELLGSSICAVICNAPLQLLLSGVWYPQAVLSGPIAAALAVLAMALSFLSLIFPSLSTTLPQNFMLHLFDFFSRMGSCT